MVRVTGIDHLVISVGDFEKSKAFYAPLMEFLGFGVEAEYAGMMGWANGKTLFWISHGRRRRQEAQIPQGRYRLSPLRLPPAQPEGRRCAASFSRRAGREDRRSRRRILRRLLRRVLSRSRRHEARRHALRREARAGRQEARREEKRAAAARKKPQRLRVPTAQDLDDQRRRPADQHDAVQRRHRPQQPPLLRRDQVGIAERRVVAESEIDELDPGGAMPTKP